jgi:hypothetical protein
MRTRILLTNFLKNVQQLCAVPCLCPEAMHDPLLVHPHVRPGAWGYPEVWA